MANLVWLVLGFTVVVLMLVFALWAVHGIVEFLTGARHVAHHQERDPFAPTHNIRRWEEIFPQR